MNNRLHNCTNPHQGIIKKVLCICSAGLLRSPTAAVVLSQEPFNYNTRAAGIVADYALIPVDNVLLTWADEIVCMTSEQEEELKQRLEKLICGLNFRKMPEVICLNIEDSYGYRDDKLVWLIREKYDAYKATKGNNNG